MYNTTTEHELPNLEEYQIQAIQGATINSLDQYNIPDLEDDEELQNAQSEFHLEKFELSVDENLQFAAPWKENEGQN